MPKQQSADSPKHIWYASYGSNLSFKNRFMCYIAGGKPFGAQRLNPGCRDKTPPQDARPVSLNFELYFAGHSRSWGGAPAFVRRGNRNSTVYGRMYLITDEQFNDVVLQENDGPVNGTRFVPPFEQLAKDKEFVLPGNRLYGHLLNIGKQDEWPVITFTTMMTDLPIGAPSEAYFKIIVSGIKETYPTMTVPEICSYMLLAEGIRNKIQPDLLTRWVSEAP